jgi:hypothetical protein
MNRCLNERALVALHTREATPAQQAHVRLCADCAERYDSVVADLKTIGRVLKTPPPAWEARRVLASWVRWVPAAIACAALLLVILDVAWVRRLSPMQGARRVDHDVTFAADLSNALFAAVDANSIQPNIIEVSYLDAALDAGHPCTQDRYLNGDCNDDVSALMIEDE